ncbi:hypothetical protein [Actinomyces sp.]|uniref:hypothetical protein n=1 Tax=Actinomyces sp. TaxID=29317 RepID=UPI0026DC6239|nr:hypothetical protein [Actinomyces sp.]MDO4653809.1 hypothetical protein [Actinomyces sp.]
MQYAQRLLAALPVTRAGLRAILAVLTAFGIVLATAGVAAMPLLNAGNVVEDYESGSACHPIARMVYPEGQSAPEYVMPVYETGFGAGVDSILLSWCSTAGEVLEDPAITLNVVEGNTVTPYLLPGIKAELERPAPANGEQEVFIPTDYLVKGMRQATGDSGWEVGTKVFSLTYTSGTESATTGLFSFVKQDPNVINPPVPEPTPEPTPEPSAEPTAEPTPKPTVEPAPEPTTAPTAEPAPHATSEPSPTPSPTASAAPSPSDSPSATASPSSSPSPSTSPKPEPTASAQPSASSSAMVATCQVKPAVQVLGSDGSDLQGAEPSYDLDTAVRVRGTGWCSQGTMLDGEKPVEIKVAAYGGYVVPGTLSVPVTFRHGSFDAQLNLSALYTGGKADKGRYYLQLSPIDSGLTAATNIFVLNKAVAPQPEPEPSPAPSPAPTPTAEPSATAESTSDPVPEPTGSPTSPAPSSEPSASPVPSARPSETVSPAPAPQTTEPDQNAPKPSSDDSGRPGTDNAAGDNPGGNPGGTSSGSGAGSGADTGAGSGAGSQADSSQQASGVGSDSGSTSQEGSAQQPANAGAGPAPNVGGSGGERAHVSEDSAASAQASQRTVRPDRSPVAPVTSAAHLSADNAGSLSGSRQGNIVNLVLPKSKAQAGEWVSVFVFPGGTTKGWVQVDDANSVSIDISTFDSGSYELAVADRDNSLLGWAKLEISSASVDPRNPAQAQLLTFRDNAAAPTRGLSANDMLLGSAGGLLVVGAVILLVAAFLGMPLRASRTSPRLRLPRRR